MLKDVSDLKLLALETVKDHEAWFGHVFDGVLDSLSAQTRVFHATIWHVVDSIHRYVIDDDAAGFDPFECGQCLLQAIRKDASLQAVIGVVETIDAL